LAHAKDSLWSVDLFRVESILLQTPWVLLVMHVYTRRDKNPTRESPKTRRLRVQLEARREQMLASQPETQTKNCRVGNRGR
jgi:hypothetical protein